MIADAIAHPGLVLIAGAALVAVLKGPWRAALALALPIVALAVVAHAPEGAGAPLSFIGVDLAPMRVDALSRLFGVAFSVAAIGGVLYGLLQPRRMELPCALLYAGAALGVVFAGDLLTVFLFWELMAIGSTLVIWSNGTPRAFRASMRYLIVHLFGGTLLLLGIAAHYVATSTPARHRSGPGWPTPTPRPTLPEPCSFPRSPPRRQSTRCCGAFPASNC